MNRLNSVRRGLGETIAELATGFLEAGADGLTRATSVELRLPIEFALQGDELLGDLPLFRRATAFDAAPTQVTVLLTETAMSAVLPEEPRS